MEELDRGKSILGLNKTVMAGPIRPFGFNVVSYVSGNLGVGIVARNMLKVLLEKEMPIAVFDLDPGLGRGKHDMNFDKYRESSPDALPYAINFFILPIVDLLSVNLLNYSTLLLRKDCLNVAMIIWELSVIPKVLKQVLPFFDVLATGSDFIRYAIEFNLGKVLTISTDMPIYIPNDIQPCRERFNLPKSKIIFITSFEPHSDPQRKNPFGVVEAFLRALHDDSRSHLVIKINNSCINGKYDPSVQALKMRCNGHPRIQLISENLSYSEVLKLYASCDVFVSLHRSEGLGLGLMEAMALGKPVIATAWSGNMSYMNYTNSCLVNYRLVSVEKSERVYKKEFVGINTVWADPNIEEAASWMKKLVDDEDLCVSIGRKAAKDMASYQQKAKQGYFIEELKTIWQQRNFLPNDSNNKHRDLHNLRNARYGYYLSQLALPKFRIAYRLHQFLNRHLLWRFYS